MSEELPREEGLPAESEESERWISNLFSALPEGRPNLFSLGVRAAERTEISRVRVCATCRRSLDKLNFSRTQWNKKQVGVSRCKGCVQLWGDTDMEKISLSLAETLAQLNT